MAGRTGWFSVFTSMPVPNAIDNLRLFIVDCRHGTTQLHLARPADGVLEALAGLVRDHRAAIAEHVAQGRDEAELGECRCEPTPAQRVKLLNQLQ